MEFVTNVFFLFYVADAREKKDLEKRERSYTIKVLFFTVLFQDSCVRYDIKLFVFLTGERIRFEYVP